MTRTQTASTYLTALFFALSWVGTSLVADEPQVTAQFIAFKHENVERKYLLHVPQNLPDCAPLVFVLHGYRADARDYTELGMNRLAGANGFAVCYPQGADDLKGIPHWNARLKISKTDDTGFLSALASHLQAQHSLSDSKTFICGISNGGFMSYTLVAEKPDVFKTAASVIGTMSGHTWENRDSTRPVPILQVSSLYEEAIKLLSETTGHHYKAAVNSNEVWHYKIREIGHSIPGEREMEISVAELIWKFFSKF